MGDTTAIAWTDHTFNPWWGCARVSPGCEHCYAEAWAKRTGRAVWGKNAARRMMSFEYWKAPLRWDRDAAAAGRLDLVFCASMADVFEDHPDVDAERERLWALIERTPNLVWQLLTKRPQNVRAMVPAYWLELGTHVTAGPIVHQVSNWPMNVWIGTTVEDQQRADERIPYLLDIPADVRFLSCEPLLGPVLLQPDWLVPPARLCGTRPATDESRQAIAHVLRAAGERLGWRGIDWVIAGGESGPGHRPLDVDHARLLREQVTAAGVPFFFKQVGGLTPAAGGDELDGVTWKQFPAGVRRG